mgnify:CR=1 FL=1
MFFRCLPVGVLQSNCYIIACLETHEACVIDPGSQGDLIQSVIEKNNLKVKYILNTHGHPDHIGANWYIKEKTNALLYIHKDDLSHLRKPLPMPYPDSDMRPSPEPDGFLEEGKDIIIGTITLKIIETPGHSPGGVCILADQKLITGDTLFAGTIGRTDLLGGSMDTLMNSIKTKLFPLNDSLEVLPGHGPSSTLGYEKKYNPFLSKLTP